MANNPNPFFSGTPGSSATGTSGTTSIGSGGTKTYSSKTSSGKSSYGSNGKPIKTTTSKSNSKIGYYDKSKGGFVAVDTGKFYPSSNPNFVPQGYTGKIGGDSGRINLLQDVKISGTRTTNVTNPTPENLKYGQQVTGKYNPETKQYETTADKKYPTQNKEFVPTEIMFSNLRTKQKVPSYTAKDEETGKRIRMSLIRSARKEEYKPTFQEGYAQTMGVSTLDPTLRVIKDESGKVLGYEDLLTRESVLAKTPTSEASLQYIELGRYGKNLIRNRDIYEESLKPTFQEGYSRSRGMSIFNDTLIQKRNKEGNIIGYEDTLLKESVLAQNGTKFTKSSLEYIEQQRAREEVILPTPTSKIKIFGEKGFTEEGLTKGKEWLLKQGVLNKMLPKVPFTNQTVLGLSYDVGIGTILNVQDLMNTSGRLVNQALKGTELYPGSQIKIVPGLPIPIGGLFNTKRIPEATTEDYVTAGVIAVSSILPGSGKVAQYSLSAGFAGLGTYQYLTATSREEQVKGLSIGVLGTFGLLEGARKVTKPGNILSKETFEALARSKKAQVKAPGKRVMTKAQKRERKITPNIGYSKQTNELVLFGKRTIKETRFRLTPDLLIKEVRAKNLNVKSVAKIDYLKGTKELSLEPITQRQVMTLNKQSFSTKDRIRLLRTLSQTKVLESGDKALLQVQLKKMGDFRVTAQKGKEFISIGYDKGKKIKYGNLPLLEKGYVSLGTERQNLILETKQARTGIYEPKIKGFRSQKIKDKILGRLYEQRTNLNIERGFKFIQPEKTIFKLKTNEILISKYAAGGSENPLIVIKQKSPFDILTKPKKELLLPSTKNRFEEFKGLFAATRKKQTLINLPEENRFAAFSELFKTTMFKGKKNIKYIEAGDIKVSVVFEEGGTPVLIGRQRPVTNLYSLGGLYQRPLDFISSRLMARPKGISQAKGLSNLLGFNGKRTNLLGTNVKPIMLLGTEKGKQNLLGYAGKSIRKTKVSTKLSIFETKKEETYLTPFLFSLGQRKEEQIIPVTSFRTEFLPTIDITSKSDTKAGTEIKQRYFPIFDISLASALDTNLFTKTEPRPRPKPQPTIRQPSPISFEPTKPEEIFKQRKERPKPRKEEPPPEIKIDLDFDFIGAGKDKKKKKKKTTSFMRSFNYVPSLAAKQLRIFGKKPKGKGKLELGIRPMLRI